MRFAGRVYQQGKLRKAILHVKDGRIEKVARSGKADIDFGDRAILPGAIDVHVHFREPGATHKEDLTTGSTAAAFGGVTAFVDMPNTLPPATSVKLVREKLALAARKSVVDYGFWGGATWYTGEVPEMLRSTVGMKVYLGASTGDLLLEDKKAFKDVLQECGRSGKPVILHCEAERVLKQYRRNEMDVADHDAARPALAEVEAIYDVMKALPGIKPAPRVHVAHCASTEAVQAARAARFSIGVCPHHLLLSHDRWDQPPGHGKMNPPLRDEARRKDLMAAFAEGRIPILESDHAPHTRTEKDGIFSSVPAGVPGVETMLPLMLARAQAGDVPLATVVDALTAAPAALLDLEDRGAIQAGMRADFSVVDLGDVRGIQARDLHSKCGWTPFEGHDAIFPTHTYLRGEAVVEEGQLVAAPGFGRSIAGG